MNLATGDSITEIMVMSFAHFHQIHIKMRKKQSRETLGRTAENHPDKDPVPKPGNDSATNKQLTGQLCIMYLPFTFTFAAFIISSCCRRKLDNAAIKDWLHISACAGCCGGLASATLLPTVKTQIQSQGSVASPWLVP